MLILTRRIGEAIIIGDNVEVTILDIRGHQVRLGIDAPKDIAVHREEIYNRIQAEKEADNVTNTDDKNSWNAWAIAVNN